MVSRQTFIGVLVVFVALLLITSTFAAVYYSEYQQEAAVDLKHQTELSLALTSYNTLLVLYNVGLNGYNQTLWLLADALSNLNTSSPAYRTAAADLASLWTTYQALASGNGNKPLVYRVNLLVDYGNGTSRWYNDSATQPGWNGYIVSLEILDGHLEADWYPQYGEHFVTGVNDVNQTSTRSWFIWEFSGSSWVPSASGADQIQAYNGTTLAWTLCPYDSSFNPGCTP